MKLQKKGNENMNKNLVTVGALHTQCACSVLNIQQVQNLSGKVQPTASTQPWSRNGNIRFKRRQGSMRAKMRKRETIEPRYVVKQKSIQLCEQQTAICNRRRRDYIVSTGVVEFGEYNIGILCIPGRTCIFRIGRCKRAGNQK